ncbi:MAG: methylmalonyl-CoA carboxyltransferase, partial [Aquificales bacterium]|nr:methylmalonyl-CoA carboxyltransferase [Aquificales bacterium]
PGNNLAAPPPIQSIDDPERLTPALADIVPQQADEPYDIHQVLEILVDDGEQLVHACRVISAADGVGGLAVGIV